ncbi:SDR family NAD(P)-dependent oxidoreductase [[Actinomadura] parvosata]|uniref:SDR family NAD(P)-dependent oxidoreductase n=1 Tax=[Actinomadura] parvosata TaxID=1955412 RepID=UPI00406C56D3
MRFPDLQGKVALVTGGSGGIGRETARVLAEQGMKVVVNGRDPAALASAVAHAERGAGQDTAQRAGGSGEVIGIGADTTDFAAIEAMRVETERRLGPVDVLAIFAGGGTGGRPRPIDELPEEDWQATVQANLTSTYLVIKSFLPGMRERGRGSIITMSSLAARTPTSASIAYTAAKAGVIALTRQLAHEVAPAGIRVNAVAPSTIMTDRLEERMPAPFKERMLAEHPLGRLGTPLDVANVTAFLASDSASSWLTGLTIDVAGGKWMP